MSATLPSSKPPCYREDAIEVVSRLRSAGHVAYFAGGCVRDVLMGLNPKDYDVATDAPPDKVRSLFRNTQAVGAAFGVVLVKIGRSVVEVATFRADGKYLDGRRPSEVRFTTAEEDAKRRDFTINGIYFDPQTNQYIDFVGGQVDIQAKLLRAIGNPTERFDEDYLRMLRAVRFAARFNLRIDPDTADAIRHHAPRLAQISPERIAEELRAMMTPPTRRLAWRMLDDLQLTPVIFRLIPTLAPTSARLRLVDQLPNAPISFGLALAAMVLELQGYGPTSGDLLSADTVKRSAQACRTLLKISNDEYDAMVGSLAVRDLLLTQPPRVSTMKRFLATPFSDDARTLLAAMNALGIHADRITWLEAQFGKFVPGTVAPAPFVTGDDLVAAGMRPGKPFKAILDHVYDLQLEDMIRDKESAMREALAYRPAS